MLSNSTSSLHARQRQHRRQNSTPSALEGVKMPTLPNANHRQATGHRRGLSLDTRRQQTASPTTRQDYKVSMNTNNTGLAPNPQHHVLREAQQQRIQAHPGTQQQHHYVPLARSDSENYLISPHDTPQTHRFDPSPCYDTSTLPFNPYGAQLNLMMQKNQESYASNVAETRDFELYNNDSALSTPTFMNFPESPSGQGWSAEEGSRRNSRRISNGIMDRVHKFENLSVDELQRPVTPPNQNGNNYLPPTPMETPHDHLIKQEARPGRFNQDFDESMEETIKPPRNRSNQRAQNVFQEMRQQSARNSAVPTPPRSSTLPNTKAFGGMQLQTPDYMSMNSLRHEFVKMDSRYDGPQYESDALHSTSDLSHRSTPDTHNMGQFIRGFDDSPDLHHFHGTHSAGGPGSEAPSRRTSPHHRRTESVASIASAASIAGINIEETKTETGVTMEEIAQYIRGPETTDGKWTCVFDDCGKQFGRKENIKSHVQTHLNDRQYQCPTCHKCFVRQHDLKRHAKIHTGIKPYPCECGNSFARHDALTRHRQRGMCIGAFDGVVRKVVKRGRPRKNRPDMDTRVEKSARQKKKNMSVSSVSSASGYSDSSAVNSPDNNFNMLDDIVDISIKSQGQKGMSLSSAPMPTMMSTRPVAEVAASPSAASAHSYVSPEAIMEKTLSNPATPARSIVSHYTPPPGLSQSSSPPPTRFFDVDPNTSAGTDELAAMPSATMPIGINDQDEDLLLQFTNDDGLVQLDRDPGMLMMSKFDEEFDNVGMFSNDDMFFA
ncbi:Metallothionein expression activator [Tolypocladium ophioglossoides CBS 100239]|uniref:Metallothionein expression activator n=1 Tax=Tolypocladium ophioglossoides (strain CBS 100239) TaxID=1163406 RepID=A0A0L0NGM3_TOLOC|nr:Metallothionein expression activator [Tolypocladium ophioglossoides CBS 100239]